MSKSSNKRPPLWSLKKSKKSLAEIEKKGFKILIKL